MVQHLLLMTLAPPLIWMGEPLIAARLTRSPFPERVGRLLGDPAFCWLAAGTALVVWHVPAIFQLGMHSPAWHFIEHASFLTTGLLFWWPVIQPWPGRLRHSDWSIPLYLFLATLPCDILSGFLVFCDYVVYGMYFSSLQPFGLSAIQDQQYAGALMWTVVTIVYVIAGAIFTVRLLSPDLAKENMAQNSASAWDVSGTVT